MILKVLTKENSAKSHGVGLSQRPEGTVFRLSALLCSVSSCKGSVLLIFVRAGLVGGGVELLESK